MSEIKVNSVVNSTGDNDSGLDLSTNDQVDIKIADSVKARVSSAGDFMVGTTDNIAGINGSTEQGVAISSGTYGGIVAISRSDASCLFLNRQTGDGSVIEIRKNGSGVGNIGVNGSQPYFINSNANSGIRIYSNGIAPATTNGAFEDNAQDIGSSSVRWDDIYATNGTIQTSDQQEKNTIEDSDLGIDFIKRLTPKSYIFNGKTRTHYGLIAQDVETVLGDISKPTSEFAGFIKTDISEEQDGSQYRYGLRYTEFVAPLIKAIKEQQTIIEDLQARITALENAE